MSGQVSGGNGWEGEVVSDLALRPSHNDHIVIGDFLARQTTDWSTRSRPIFHRLMLDATVAVKQSQLAVDAAAVGLPVIVDPLTFFAQSLTESDRGWSALPFGFSEARAASHFGSDRVMNEFVASVVEFEIENGASWIVPPYFYASGPRDDYFIRTLTAIKVTREYLRSTGREMPLMPILSAKLDGFASKASWGNGLDWFAQRCKAAEVDTIGLLMSPVGHASDTYQKAAKLVGVARRLMGHGLRVQVLRQGAFGPLLVALGAAGYETGLQYGNGANIPALANRKKPHETEVSQPSGGGAGQLFVPALGRWILSEQATVLRDSSTARPFLLCDDPTGCCPSLASTFDNRRPHAVRSHARRLAELDTMPNSVEWRLHAIRDWSGSAHDAIVVMNKALRRANAPTINPASHAAIRDLANHIIGVNLAA